MGQQGKDNRIEVLCHGLANPYNTEVSIVKVFKVGNMALPLGSEERR